VSVRWYAVALLTAPLLSTAVHSALSLHSPEFLPGIVVRDDTAFLLLFGLAAGLLFGIFEELGWTGFAIPRLRRRHSILATGLTLGLVWGAWHFGIFWERDSFSGALPLAVVLASLFSWLPAYRVLMVWVYDRTESLLVAMLMHASLSASMLIFQSATTSGMAQLTFLLVWAAVLWIVVAAVAVASGGQLSRPPLRQTDAPHLMGRRAA
jgi:membrane protease YdiL (CAAX protease family)